jgi:8-oxo-dGTP diphosphatase
MIAYQYPDAPRVGVGALIFKDDCVLLIKRGKSPSKGMWTVPGGKLELGETLQEAAEREVLEETGIIVKAQNPVHIFDMVARDDDGRIKYHYVIVDVETIYISGEPKAGDDADDARWVRFQDLESFGVGERTLALLKKFIEL